MNTQVSNLDNVSEELVVNSVEWFEELSASQVFTDKQFMEFYHVFPDYRKDVKRRGCSCFGFSWFKKAG
jgi:hypothetical protein